MTSQHWCLHCMSGYVQNGICRTCGKPEYDANRNTSALPFGFALGRYRLGRVLGQGGFGITYQAWDTEASHAVALKEFFPVGSVYRDENGIVRVYQEKQGYFQHIRDRFEQEARLIYNMRGNPEIFQIYSLFASHGTVCYVMEYLNGYNLQEYFQREQHLEWQHLEGPLWSVLCGLRILHQHHLIHRDISPDNIFLLNDGTAKLIDFGSARNYQTSDHFTGIFKGSLAPLEMYDEKSPQGPWTDIFSFSATIYYLLSGGKMPTHVYDRQASVSIYGRDSLVPLSEYAPLTPTYIQKALEQGLALKPTARQQSVEEVRDSFFPGRQFPSNAGKPDTNNDSQNGGRSSSPCQLCCTGGLMRGRRFALPAGQVVSLGRGPEGSHTISYPVYTQGVSRRQCSFYRSAQDDLYVMDLGSTYGTYLNGQKMPSNVWQRAALNQIVAFGGEEFRFVK